MNRDEVGEGRSWQCMVHCVLLGWPYFWKAAIMGKSSEPHGGKCPALDPAASVLGTEGSPGRGAGLSITHSFIHHYSINIC